MKFYIYDEPTKNTIPTEYPNGKGLYHTFLKVINKWACPENVRQDEDYSEIFNVLDSLPEPRELTSDDYGFPG